MGKIFGNLPKNDNGTVLVITIFASIIIKSSMLKSQPINKSRKLSSQRAKEYNIEQYWIYYSATTLKPQNIISWNVVAVI